MQSKSLKKRGWIVDLFEQEAAQEAVTTRKRDEERLEDAQTQERGEKAKQAERKREGQSREEREAEQRRRSLERTLAQAGLSLQRLHEITSDLGKAKGELQTAVKTLAEDSKAARGAELAEMQRALRTGLDQMQAELQRHQQTAQQSQGEAQSHRERRMLAAQWISLGASLAALLAALLLFLMSRR
jgi:Sec-independent protein translocase protein TatA